MTFEGQELDIPIKGIMRAGADNLCADGAMNEVIGMEYKDGSYVPYGKSYDEEFYTPISGISKTYVHKTDSKDIQIFVSDDDGTVSFLNKYGLLQSTEISGATDIEFVGNMMCVMTDSGIKYALYKNESYVLQTNNADNNTPTQPYNIQFRVQRGLYDKDSTAVDYCGIITHKHTKTTGITNTDDFIENWESILNSLTSGDNAIAALASARGKVRDEGGLTGFFLVCAAYRLNDGSYAMATPPILMSAPNILHREYTSGKIFLSTNENSAVTSQSLVMPAHISESNPDSTLRSVIGEVAKVNTRNVAIFTIGDSPYETRLVESTGWEDERMPKSQKEGMAFCNTTKDGITNPTSITDSKYADSTDTSSWWKYYSDVASADSSDTHKPTEYIPQPLRYSTGVHYDSDLDAYCINEVASCVCNTLELYLSSQIAENTNIEGLSIFMSQEILPYSFDTKEKLDKRGCVFWGASNLSASRYTDRDVFKAGYSFLPTYKSSSAILSEIKQLNTLYLVKDFTREEVNANTDKWINIDLKGILGDNLLVREQLPLTAFASSSLGSTLGGHLFAYNYRLHNFDYEKISETTAYAPLALYRHHGGLGQYAKTGLDGTNIEYEIDVYANGDGGETVAVRHERYLAFGGVFISSFSPAIFYPNANANKITIRIKKNATSDSEISTIGVKTYILAETRLGMACYIDAALSPNTIQYNSVSVPNLPVEEPVSIKEIYKNGLMVSETAFPMSFPAKYTYRIGDGTILGMARLTIALSQDTFGRYPLLVFCTDGIYSMGIDETGNGAYTNIAPFSREVCVNPKTICEIDGAVLFASNKGLMIASQGNVQEFCPQLNGSVRFSPEDTNPTSVGHKMFSAITSNKRATVLSDAMDKQDFIDYLKNANTIISYVGLKNKVIVYNKTKNYVYWIDIPTRNTTKLNICIEFDDDNYPSECYFKHGADGYLTYMSFPYVADSNATTQCMFQTRPIKIQQGLKTAFRVAMTGYFHGQQFDSCSDKNFAELVVLGSLDGEHWIPIGIKEKCLDEPFHNLGCVTDRVSCNYIMILFAGRLYPDSHIDGIKITNESKYNNKLKV